MALIFGIHPTQATSDHAAQMEIRTNQSGAQPHSICLDRGSDRRGCTFVYHESKSSTH